MKKLGLIIALLCFIGLSFGQNQTNSEITKPGILKYVFNSPSDLVGCGNILIYADDPYHIPPNTYVDQALQNLGYSYTAYYNSDFAGFETALTGSSWDIVIFANDNWGPPSTTYSALLTYINGGGKLLFHTWGSDAALFAALGVSTYTPYSPGKSVYWWQLGHPVFNIPNTVPEPTLNGNFFGTYGFDITSLPGFEQLAGYTTPGPDAGQEALLLGNNDRTIFKGFLDGQYNSELIPLYENMIYGLCNGFSNDPIPMPISDWAIGLGVLLIIVFSVIRFRKLI